MLLSHKAALVVAHLEVASHEPNPLPQSRSSFPLFGVLFVVVALTRGGGGETNSPTLARASVCLARARPPASVRVAAHAQ